MYKLNLPVFDYKLRKTEGKVWIFDVIRKKYILLTAEEWVRQHFVHFLITGLNCPAPLIKVEGGLTYNKLRKRSDIVVFDRQGSPWMIVECKSPEQKLSPEVLHQAGAYNASLQAQYVTLTNGLVHLCLFIDKAAGKATLLEGLPQYPDNT